MGLDLSNLKLIMPEETQERVSQSGEPYELLIIGGGPAGMTAAVYSARKQVKTLLISKDLGGQLLMTADIENYMGYQYISGRELTDKFRTQMEQFPIVDIILDDSVKEISEQNNMFVINTDNGRQYMGHSAIIATGKRYKPLGVPGEKELVGRGVSYCATCDAPLFKDKDVAIIGGGNSALESAVDLVPIANKIYLVNIVPSLQADPILIDKVRDAKNIIKFMPYKVTSIQGEKAVSGMSLESLETQESKELPVQGVFVEIGLMPNSEFVKEFIHLSSRDEIVVDCSCRTSVPGIFGAGDVTTVPEKQISVAIGEGSKAALSAYRYLLMSK